MLESIEIIENFEDLNRTQKYQLKVPLYRNDKQYITELENNVNHFMNQIGKNNFITEDQMEVIMPRYVQKDKKRRVNRAKAQADKVRREVDQLRNEERIYGKATFKFANELPDESSAGRKPTQPTQNSKLPFLANPNNNNTSQHQSIPTPRLQDALRYISTDEYKDYKFQYKPFVASTPQVSLLPHVSESTNSRASLRHSMESALNEKSQAYFIEQQRIQKKWSSAFKNIDGNSASGNEELGMPSASTRSLATLQGLGPRKLHHSQDNLLKSFKQPPIAFKPRNKASNGPGVAGAATSVAAASTSGIGQPGNLNYDNSSASLLQQSGNQQVEPTDEELLVSANNLTVHDLLNNIKLRNLPATVKTPDNYIFQEFMQLAKQSLGQIQHADDANSGVQSKASLKDDMRNLNIKLHSLKKDNERFVLFKVFKAHFQPILERNKPSIMTRIFLALDINPHEDYAKVRWNEYYLFNKIVVDQSASVIDNINFLINFFGINEKKYMRTMEFMALLRLVCSKFDEFLTTKGRPSIFDLLEENFTVLGLIKAETEFMSLSDLRALLLSHRIHHSTLLQLIIATL